MSAAAARRRRAGWRVAGARKILLPARRAGSLASGPDGRLALAQMDVVSALAPSAVRPRVAQFGGSAALSPSTWGALVLGTVAASHPQNVYPAAAGHEFVCEAPAGEAPHFDADRAALSSTAAEAARGPCARDVQALAWGPAAAAPALLVLAGDGGLHVVRARAVAVARARGDFVAQPPPPPPADVDAAGRMAVAGVCDETTNPSPQPAPPADSAATGVGACGGDAVPPQQQKPVPPSAEVEAAGVDARGNAVPPPQPPAPPVDIEATGVGSSVDAAPPPQLQPQPPLTDVEAAGVSANGDAVPLPQQPQLPLADVEAAVVGTHGNAGPSPPPPSLSADVKVAGVGALGDAVPPPQPPPPLPDVQAAGVSAHRDAVSPQLVPSPPPAPPPPAGVEVAGVGARDDTAPAAADIEVPGVGARDDTAPVAAPPHLPADIEAAGAPGGNWSMPSWAPPDPGGGEGPAARARRRAAPQVRAGGGGARAVDGKGRAVVPREVGEFPPYDVQGVDVVLLWAGGSMDRGEAAMVAVATMAGVACFYSRDGFETPPVFGCGVGDGWAGAVRWLGMPATRDGGTRDTAFLAVARLSELEVFRVSVVCEAQPGAGDGNYKLECARVWGPSRALPGAVVAMDWWWEVAEDVGGARPRRLTLRLAACAENRIAVLSWAFRSAKDSTLTAEPPGAGGWASKLRGDDFVATRFCEVFRGPWAAPVAASVGKEAPHAQVVSGVRFVVDGRLVSCSEDGTAACWALACAEGYAGGDGVVEMRRDGYLEEGDVQHPVFGLAPLRLGLCVALHVRVPCEDEAFAKTNTTLLMKYKLNARLSRVVVMAPVWDEAGKAEAVVCRAVGVLIGSAHAGGGVVADDLEKMLEHQSKEFREAALAALWALVESLQRQSLELPRDGMMVCGRVVRCIVAVITRLQEWLGEVSRKDEAQALLEDIADTLLYMRCCAVLESATGAPEKPGDGGAAAAERLLEKKSRLERASIYSICSFILAARDTNAGKSVTYAEELAAMFASACRRVSPSGILLTCAVCACDEELAATPAQTALDVVGCRGMAVRCAQGEDEWQRCALTMLPCTNAVPLRCVGCRGSIAYPFLTRDDCMCVATADGHASPFSWLAEHTSCPLCACSYAGVDPVGVDIP